MGDEIKELEWQKISHNLYKATVIKFLSVRFSFFVTKRLDGKYVFEVSCPGLSDGNDEKFDTLDQAQTRCNEIYVEQIKKVEK